VKRRWTEHDDESLSFQWGAPVHELAEKFGRSVVAIRWRARTLGLHLGHAQGHEYITHAAKRCGFSVVQLRRILWAQHVRIYSSPMGDEKRSHSVDPDDVDRAVEMWCKSEPLLVAARRWGVHPQTVRRALQMSGERTPKKPGFRQHWRIPREVIDRAMRTIGNPPRERKTA
jgi:hypothetical protein